jgi:hypothetical protein
VSCPRRVSPPIKKNWPKISIGEFCIIGNQRSLKVAQIILQDLDYVHELKEGRTCPIHFERIFTSFQGLVKREEHCLAMYLENTVEKRLPYPKIFLKLPKDKPDTYYSRGWHKQCKIVREISVFFPIKCLFDANNDIE